jgi:predicted amidohydrolase
MRTPLLVCLWLAVLIPVAASGAPKADQLVVAAVQFRSTHDLSRNVAEIRKHIKQSAADGVRVIVFPECALTGYYEEVITNLSSATIETNLTRICAACREANIYAIIGSPTFRDNKLYNSAIVISPRGEIIERYHKIQLAERWPEPGDHLSVFHIDGVPCSAIICHDERYPELVRLPVLAGARVIFYLSHESGLPEEHKIAPYRAQIQARAVENSVFVVHANAPANKDLTGSHGQSRIISPDGNILKEASIFDEETLTAKLNLSKASGSNAKPSLTRGPLQDWWKTALQRVRIIE